MAQFLVLTGIQGKKEVYVNITHLESFTEKSDHVLVRLTSGIEIQAGEDMPQMYGLLDFANKHPEEAIIDTDFIKQYRNRGANLLRLGNNPVH